MACTGLNALDPICQVATSIGHLGASVTNSVFSSVATAFGNTADSAINWLWSQMTSATAVSFGGASFALDLGIVSAIAAVVCVGLFLIQLATSALRRDGSGIGRALRGLVVATLGCAVALASLDLLLGAVDQLCSGVVRVATGGSISTLGAKIIDPAMFTGLVAGPAAILILSLIAIVAVAVVWFALVVRKMLIIITAIFAPLAFAGGVADFSRGWVRKWLEAMVALIFSKLILILIFVIGLGVLGGLGSPQNAVGLTRITGDITGLLILLVAGLSPWMALKLVHFTGEHMATLAGSATHATSGASRIITSPQKMASMRSTAMGLGVTPKRASSTLAAAAPLGAGASVGATNGDTLSGSPGARGATSAVNATTSAGAAAATGEAVGIGGAAAATMHAAHMPGRHSTTESATSSARGSTKSASPKATRSDARSDAQAVTMSSGVPVARATPQVLLVNSPSSELPRSEPQGSLGSPGLLTSSGPLAAQRQTVARGTSDERPSSVESSPSLLLSQSLSPADLTPPVLANQPTAPTARRATSPSDISAPSPVPGLANSPTTRTTTSASPVPPLKFTSPATPPQESS